MAGMTEAERNRLSAWAQREAAAHGGLRRIAALPEGPQRQAAVERLAEAWLRSPLYRRCKGILRLSGAGMVVLAIAGIWSPPWWLVLLIVLAV